MRLVIFSQNRLAGLGVASLAEGRGFDVAVSSIDQAYATAWRTSDLALIYGNMWDDDCRRAIGRIHALHIPFLVVLRGMDAPMRRELLCAGAIHAFHQDESAELASVLCNFSWSMSPPPDEFALANDFTVNLVHRNVQRGDHDVGISLTECRVLAVLRAQALTCGTKPFPLPDLNVAVWGDAGGRQTSTLRGYISRLRDKVEVDPEHPVVLCGRRRQGYWLVLAGLEDV